MTKTSLLKLIPVAILSVSLFTVSCKKDDAPAPVQQKSITELATSTPDLSLLAAAVTRAGLATTLSSAGTFTVFAPTNAAFTSIGLGTVDAINAMDPTVLSGIILYHALGSVVNAAGVPAGPNAEVTSLNGAKLFTTSNAGGVYINGIKVVTADISASNGVVHIIDKVLLPPSGNIVATAIANPDFTYLVAAITRASQGTTNVATVLSGTGPFTVFAPTNQAFINAGFATIADINAANPDDLTPILTYHAIGARVFSSDLTEGATPATLNGANVLIQLNGGAQVKGTSNLAPSNITATDIVTTNGVIHVIDQVLLP